MPGVEIVRPGDHMEEMHILVVGNVKVGRVWWLLVAAGGCFLRGVRGL